MSAPLPGIRGLPVYFKTPEGFERAIPSTVPAEGESPNPASLPAGCACHPRCPHAMQHCTQNRPPLIAVDGNHRLAGWLNGGQGTTIGGS
jgi:oligopeptide/dipeptide ABC transporter ATP-binding protein